jgi:hypothetical protein
MLTAFGVPPDAQLYLAVVSNYAKVLVVSVTILSIQRYHYLHHQRLSPSEQYRRHLAAGGYRP